MKKITLPAILLFCIALTSFASTTAKRYEVKSGIVHYKIEGGGSLMGITTKSSGTQELYFKEYGNKEIRIMEDSTVTMGHANKTRTVTKIENGTVYTVDESTKQIIKQEISAMKQMQKEGKNLSVMGKKMLKQLGAKQTGTEKILGYPCEIWEMTGVKMWIYKGVPLKVVSKFMGFEHKEVATSAKFNVPVDDRYFKLPDYPVVTLEEMIQKQMMDDTAAEANPSKTPTPPQPSAEEMKQMQEMLQNLGKMFNRQ